MNETGAAILLGLWLLLPVPTQAKQTLPKQPTLWTAQPDAKIPADQWVYSDLQRLRHHKEMRAAKYPDYASSGNPAYNRDEFATIITDELCALDASLEWELKQDPQLWRAVCRLTQEFAPELRNHGVNLTALQQRLTRISRSAFASAKEAWNSSLDVPRNHWAFASVKRLRELGILIGYPPTGFWPPAP